MKPQEKSSGPSRAWNWWRWQITESSASVVEEGVISRWSIRTYLLPWLRRRLTRSRRPVADTVITACQQCVRTILTTARRKEIPINAMDITEFVLKNMA